GSSLPSRTVRSLPFRSVTNMSPLGSHARLQGCHRPVAMVVVLTGVALAFCLFFALSCGCPWTLVGRVATATNTPTDSATNGRKVERRFMHGSPYIRPTG